MILGKPLRLVYVEPIELPVPAPSAEQPEPAPPPVEQTPTAA
jgi:hypothetical protein